VTRLRAGRSLGLAGRLLALGGTAYFLIATSSYPPPSNVPPNSSQQACYHDDEALTFHVTGTCGPEGTITVMSEADDCAIAIQGAGAVGLPSAGRFDVTSAQTVSLSESTWKVSGYLPETTAVAPGPFTVVGSDAGATAGTRDAGPFTLAGSDASATGGTRDAGPFTVVGSDASATGASDPTHGKLVARSCTYLRNGSAQTLSCLDNYTSSCQAVLTPQ
jgi:hypothetical protein